MSDEQILKQVIEKARLGGWLLADDMLAILEDVLTSDDEGAKANFFRGTFVSHDFAKAFWGGERKHDLWRDADIITCSTCGAYSSYMTEDHGRLEAESCQVPPWRYHLQQMVLEENPLRYLEKFLEEEK